MGVGLSVSALSLTMQQAMLYNFMLVLPMTLLSGLMTPVRNMPQALQTVTHANPLRFGVSIVRRVYLEGATLADVAPDFLHDRPFPAPGRLAVQKPAGVKARAASLFFATAFIA